jgi:hypothetical protein
MMMDYLLSVKGGAMGGQKKGRGLVMTWFAVAASNVIGSSLVLGASERIQCTSNTSSIELNVEGSDIKVIRELGKVIDEIGGGDSDRNVEVEARFVCVPQFGSMSWKEPREEGKDEKEEFHLGSRSR